MILVDTNILVKHLRKPSAREFGKLNAEELVICGVIKAEILHGAKGEHNFAELLSFLDNFDEIEINPDYWIELGRRLFTLRCRGITVPLADAMIATLALTEDLEIWSNDKHFEMMQKVWPELKLFQKTK